MAPLLGVVGRPMTDAAAAAECFEGEDLPAPPSALVSGAAATSGCHNLAQACTPGLLMPQVETLVPSDHARHTYEMQVCLFVCVNMSELGWLDCLEDGGLHSS